MRALTSSSVPSVLMMTLARHWKLPTSSNNSHSSFLCGRYFHQFCFFGIDSEFSRLQPSSPPSYYACPIACEITKLKLGRPHNPDLLVSSSDAIQCPLLMIQTLALLVTQSRTTRNRRGELEDSLALLPLASQMARSAIHYVRGL